jgi:hypothetical protein
MHNSSKQTQLNVAMIIFADLPQQTINHKPAPRCTAKNYALSAAHGLVSAAVLLGFLP